MTQNLTFWSLRRLRHTFLNVFGYELSESVLISFRVRPGFLTNLRLNVKKSCFLLKLCQKLSTIIFYLFLLKSSLNFASFDISYVKVVMKLKVWELKIDFLLLVDRPHHFFQLLNSLKPPICIQFWQIWCCWKGYWFIYVEKLQKFWLKSFFVSKYAEVWFCRAPKINKISFNFSKSFKKQNWG